MSVIYNPKAKAAQLSPEIKKKRDLLSELIKSQADILNDLVKRVNKIGLEYTVVVTVKKQPIVLVEEVLV